MLTKGKYVDASKECVARDNRLVGGYRNSRLVAIREPISPEYDRKKLRKASS